MKNTDITQLEFKLPVIRHEEGGELICQRQEDGYINATAMCKVAGKRFANWYRLDSTKEFLAELSIDIGIPISTPIMHNSAMTRNRVMALILVRRGGNPNLLGTWVHPDVATYLAMWLSPKFAVKVIKWVNDWMTGKNKPSRLPYHLRRYSLNSDSIPHDYFSVLQEMNLALVRPLEDRGYTLPEGLVPDISEGLMFAKWMREQGVDTKTLPTYPHRYEDGRVVKAKLYPIKYVGAFRIHVFKVWLPTKAYAYFEERDKAALPYINKMLQIAS